MTEQLAIINPAKAMMAFRKCNTPALCIESKAPALAVIRKEKGDTKARQAVELWISDLNDFLNISRKMSPQQIQQTATLIIQEFFYFNLADVNLIFTRAKKGQYGNFYESLDGPKIFSWFDQYDRERAETAYYANLKQHDIVKATEMR